MKKQFYFSKRILTLLLIIASGSLWSQDGVIKGTVTSTSGESIPGVNLAIKGGNKGAITDFDGMYSIENLEDGVYTIVTSYIGFKTVIKNATVSGNTVTLDFQLADDMLSLDDVVITGVVNPKSKISSSVSVSTLKSDVITQSAPRTTGEIFRNIPGVRAESSSGDGNANFNVRGVPVSSGGSRYLQLQEDGLPLNLFGDTSFGNADNWLRADANIARIEAVRGGSASTQTSNGPAGIINLISKTGATESGSATASIGADFNSFRTDFEYGAPIGDGFNFHMGGFLRSGEGPRSAGFIGNKGGQFKANVTKNFKKGYIRTYFKLLNDRAVQYMPMPMLLEGSDSDPTYANLPGFDITNDGLQSRYLQESAGLLSTDNSRRVGDVRDGNNPISQAVGMDMSFDLGDDWKISNKGRIAINKGGFMAPFSATFGQTADVLNTLNGIGTTDTDPIGQFDLSNATLSYSDDGSVFNPSNGLLQVIHLFDVTIEDMSNFVNDFKLSKQLGVVSLTGGYFRMQQNTKTSWQWNSYLQEVKGGGDARLVDIDGISRGGQYAYGTPLWGNCCQRKYNTVHTVSAPYFGIGVDINEQLNFDGSIRLDLVTVDGTIAGGNTPQQFDINGNQTIEPIEEIVPVVQADQNQIIGDSYDYLSYSLGLNYQFSNNNAVFGRYSLGASGRAPDRNGYINGVAATQYDQVSQFELGYKQRFNNSGIFVTGFYSNTDEDAGGALNLTVGNEFRAYGLEVEGSGSFGNFEVSGSVTWTDAEITEDRASGTGANTGNKPQRQADFIYNLSPVYNFGTKKQHALGLSILGTSKSFAFDSNDLVQPGYAYVNLLARLGLTEGLSIAFNVNNILDTVGITEVNGIEGSTAANGDRYVRARSISGRSTTITLAYKF